MPNGGKIYIGADQRGKDTQTRTDASLHSQPGPDRIKRMLFTNNMGMLDSDANGFPNTGGVVFGEVSMQPPGHTRIPKYIYRPPSQVGSNLSDDTVQIDSPGVGTSL